MHKVYLVLYLAVKYVKSFFFQFVKYFQGVGFCVTLVCMLKKGSIV